VEVLGRAQSRPECRQRTQPPSQCLADNQKSRIARTNAGFQETTRDMVDATEKGSIAILIADVAAARDKAEQRPMWMAFDMAFQNVGHGAASRRCRHYAPRT
jgi:hypothetical protein